MQTRAQMTMAISMLALAALLHAPSTVEAKGPGFRARVTQLRNQTRKAVLGTNRNLVRFGLKARARIGRPVKGNVKVMTNAWSMKNGVKVRQYDLLNASGQKVGYQRTFDGKPGRTTMVRQDLSMGIKHQTKKQWTGKNGTQFTSSTLKRTNGIVWKTRSAQGRNGGMTRSAVSSQGTRGKTKRWQAKQTVFEHRNYQLSSGARGHSRVGFPVQLNN